MKTIFLAVVIFLCSQISLGISIDTIAHFDSIHVENTIADTITRGDEKSIVEKTEEEINAEKNAQWFIYGFLGLGAFLVFWKFKNNK
ncbi:MAG: hypothetical protein ABF242_02305 [Flavobacteriales bacterium]